MTAAPAIGDPAPTLSLPLVGGGTFTLADHRGHPVVVFFFPKADAGSCQKEAAAFTALGADFAALGARVVGVSGDSTRKQTRFQEKFALGVDLASDEGRDTVERWGVWVKKSMYGRAYMGIERATFVIAADGTVARIWRNVRVDGHAYEVLDAVRAL